jgi:hypothetical protein
VIKHMERFVKKLLQVQGYPVNGTAVLDGRVAACGYAGVRKGRP